MFDAWVPPVARIFDDLHEGLDRAGDVEFECFDEVELDAAVQDLAAVRARLDGFEARVLAAWDARRSWAHQGARSPAAWLASVRRVPVSGCRRAPRVARKLVHLPAVAAALEAGRIESAHVDRILAADTPRTHAALVADQVEITRWAMEYAWLGFVRRLQDWLAEVDPDGPEPGGADRRRFHCSRTFGDGFALDGWLDPLRGSIFSGELERLERLGFEADWAQAKARLGRDPLPHELARTPQQRRADALVAMAERSATLPGEGRRGRPLFTVLAGQDSLRGILELTNGIQLRPGQLVEYLDPALVEFAIFDAPTNVVGISRQRTYTGIVRKAVQIAHRRCAHPTCEEPIDRCEVDHIIEAAKGGITSQANGRLLCGYHNRLRNKAPPADTQ